MSKTAFKRILMILLLAILLVGTFNTSVLARQEKQDVLGGGSTKATMTPKSITAAEVDDTAVKTIGQRLVGILQAVGIVLSVVILIVIGIKYMLGSAEEKAEYKKTLMPYIIGAALIFAASMFAQSAYDFFSGLGNTSTTVTQQTGGGGGGPATQETK